MKTLIIYSSSSTFRPRSVVASLAVDQASPGHGVQVLDVSSYSYVNQDLPPRWFARLCGHDVHVNAFADVLSAHNVGFEILHPTPSREGRSLSETVAHELDEAVYSELVTYIHSDKPDMKNWFTSYTSQKIRASAAPLYWDLREYLRSHRFDRVLIPNGRVPDQRMALWACKDESIPVEYYEIGRALENSYYTGTMQVHDREGTQAEVLRKTAHLEQHEIEAIADRWLDNRMTNGLAIHPFGKDWKPGNDSLLATAHENLEKPVAVFFSSSVDEFASYGQSWATHAWRDQYEAFEAIIELLVGRGFLCVVRMHPNLQNKGREYVSAEIKRVLQLKEKFPGTIVLSHTDPTNSYELIQLSHFVIVGRSTLGLEASCLGKPVWTTTAARYDAVADVRQVLKPSEVTDKNLSEWPVDSGPAKRFVAYWVIQDHEFTYGESTWSTWDTLQSPLSMRIANLLIRNSLAHRFHLIRLQFVKSINRQRGFALTRKLATWGDGKKTR